MFNSIIGFLNLIIDEVREDFGDPVRCRRLLLDPDKINTILAEPVKTIKLETVEQWHNWSPNQTSCLILNKLLKNIVDKKEIKNWSCDIQNVSGLSSSKSDLSKYVSLHDMAINCSKQHINVISNEKLFENLDYIEVRITKPTNISDHFEYVQWDGRIFLNNGGGSHHFATARYIAAELKKSVKLYGKLKTYTINENSVAALISQFDMYAIKNDSNIVNKFSDIMRSYQALYYQLALPYPFTNSALLILLPKSEKCSRYISHLFKKAEMFDVGAYFISLSRRNPKLPSI